ncbi:hypothetical protein F5Y17DRAFT_476079 [Xylariaceae sp. FL0594]|nr:hypothetical protein F5Y17DRAFT_476079 [Xylariaceae sp. FL0594]
MCKKPQPSRPAVSTDTYSPRSKSAAVPVAMFLFLFLTLAAWALMWFQLRGMRKRLPDLEAGPPRRATIRRDTDASPPIWRRFLNRFRRSPRRLPKHPSL